jgi:hypothetical protein
MLDPLAIGNCTLKADVRDERRTRNRRGATGVNVARGNRKASVSAPAPMTAKM